MSTWGFCQTRGATVKRLPVCVLAVVVIGLLLPCLAQAATPIPGGVLTFALQSDPVSIEPLHPDYPSGGASQICQALFSGLTQYQLQPDGTLATVPAVASSWDVSIDAKVFTFHLRSGVMFAAPVSREVHAQDFVYAWNRATNPANGLAASWFFAAIQGWSDSIGGSLHGLSGVKALDNYTLEVTLRYSFADFPSMLANPIAAPVPKEYIESLGTTAAAQNKAFGQQPVGDGPYMLKSWTHNQQIVLVRNPTFWDTANAGNVDEIDLPIYADPAQEWTDFENGNLDFAAIPQGQVQAAITTYGQSLDGYTVAPGSQVLTGPADWMEFISFNCTKVPFNNADVRRAFSLAINRPAIANLVDEGTPTLASDILPPGIAGYQANAWAYSHYDPTAAAALLATAVADGAVLPATITYKYDTSPVHTAVAQQVQTDLAAIGVTVTLVPVDPGSYWPKLYAGDFMMARGGWIADGSCAADFLYYLFDSGQNQALAFYSNPTVDAELAAAQSTIDAGARLADYQAVDATIGLDAPVIPLYAPANLGVGAARLSNAVLSPFGQFDFAGVWLSNGDQPVASIPSLTSPTNTVSTHWYANSTPTFSWVGSPTVAAAGLAAPTVMGYSYLLDQNPFAFPPSTVMTTDTTFTAPPMADGLWYFHLRAQGDDGIWGPVKTYAVRIDTHHPTTSAPKSSSVRRGSVATLAYKVSDAAPNAGWANVTIKIRNTHGHLVKSLNLGKRSVNKLLTKRFTCTLAKGTYRFSVYATDAAGNSQSRVGSNKLTVR